MSLQPLQLLANQVASYSTYIQIDMNKSNFLISKLLDELQVFLLLSLSNCGHSVISDHTIGHIMSHHWQYSLKIIGRFNNKLKRIHAISVQTPTTIELVFYCQSHKNVTTKMG